MGWIPDGFGWNVPTVLWLQTSALEVALVGMVMFLLRLLGPIISRQAEILGYLDSLTQPTAADEELRKVRAREPRP